jgi:hypothetical protein
MVEWGFNRQEVRSYYHLFLVAFRLRRYGEFRWSAIDTLLTNPAIEILMTPGSENT